MDVLVILEHFLVRPNWRQGPGGGIKNGKDLEDIIKISLMFDKQIRHEKNSFQHVIQPQELPL